MSAYEFGQRVHDARYGDGTIYALWRRWVFVEFDGESEDRAYTYAEADALLSGVTSSLLEAPKPDLATLVTAISKCRDGSDCERCVAHAVCTAARSLSAFDRKLLAVALIEEAS